MHEIHPVVNAKQNIKLQMSYIDISLKLTCLQTNAHREFGFLFLNNTRVTAPC